MSALLDAAAQLREGGLAARPFTVVTSRPDVVAELLSGSEAALADLTFTVQCVSEGSSPAQALCSRDDETVKLKEFRAKIQIGNINICYEIGCD